LPNLSSCGFNVQTSRLSCHGVTTLRWCSTNVGDTLKSHRMSYSTKCCVTANTYEPPGCQ
jgi:hypothetical protein